MSDSDGDLTNNVFTFQNNSMVVSARGPGSVASSSGFRFRSNGMSSTMHMARNFEQQRYGKSLYMQQNSYRGRETSPMSACDMRQRNFNNSFYPRYGQGMSSQRSMYNGRGGSPMSVRSVNTTSSVVSAMDIAVALKNEKFNHNDLRLITNAYKKLMKREGRKRIEKRSNFRRFIKGSRHRSDDSGSSSHASNSSVSSDDMPTNYKENMSSARSTKTDVSDLRRTIQDTDIYRDCSQNFQYNRLRGMVGVPSINLNNTQLSVQSYKSNTFSGKPAVLLKERFGNNNNGWLLPSQRFNRSVASSIIPEGAETGKCESIFRKATNEKCNTSNNIETDSDQEDIFSARTNKKNSNNNDIRRKRNIESDDDIHLPNRKKPKTASPCKNSVEFKKSKSKEIASVANNNQNDFVFVKPAMPVWKSCNLNKEKLISKSAGPLSNSLVQPSVLPHSEDKISESEKPVEDEEKALEVEHPNTGQSTSDLSMRPSFIKRKLFTQKLDVAEQINISTENLIANSPQTSIYSEIQKERSKARKLQKVTTQSCLSRDVLQDESNLLDLIHKIVPPDQMNITNRTNKTDIQNSRNRTENESSKSEFDSILSTKINDDNESDTYTDEEAFNLTVKETTKEKLPKPLQKNDHKTGAEKSSATPHLVQKLKPCTVKIDVINKSMQKCIKSFWDTDYESEAESLKPTKEKKKEEEAFNLTVKETTKEKLPKPLQKNDHKTGAEKSSATPHLVQKLKPCTVKIDVINKSMQKCIKSFWDTDYESEAESLKPTKEKKKEEEAFNLTVKETTKKKLPKPLQKNDHKTGAEKSSATPHLVQKLKPCTVKIDVINKSMQKCIKSFWDTDYESEAESLKPTLRPKLNNQPKETARKDNMSKEAPNFQARSTTFSSMKIKNTSIANLSMYSNNANESIKKFNNSTLKIRSHRAPKRKELNETVDEHMISTLEPQSKKQKTSQICSNSQLSKLQNANKIKIQKDTETKKFKLANQSLQDSKIKTITRNISTTNNNMITDKEPTKVNNIKNSYKKKGTTEESKHTKETEDAKGNKNKTVIRKKSKDKCPDVVKHTNNKETERSKTRNTNEIKQSQTKTIAKSLQNKSKTKKQNVNNKNVGANKRQTQKESPKTKKANKTLRNNSSIFNQDITTEETNNRSRQPVRACRNKENVSQDKSNSTLDGTLYRSLRSRQIELSFSTSNSNTTNSNIEHKNKKKSKPKNVNTKDSASRLSDISFSLIASKNLAKRAVSKGLKSLKTNNNDTSDVSFTLNESPAPKKALFANTRVKSKTENSDFKKSTPVKTKSIQSKETKATRKKIPNKKYMS